ncbi:MAG: hypothetical protein ACPGLY_15280 [Rubripirellula sp.]
MSGTLPTHSAFAASTGRSPADGSQQDINLVCRVVGVVCILGVQTVAIVASEYVASEYVADQCSNGCVQQHRSR